jgi:hypothetical protein
MKAITRIGRLARKLRTPAQPKPTHGLEQLAKRLVNLGLDEEARMLPALFDDPDLNLSPEELAGRLRQKLDVIGAMYAFTRRSEGEALARWIKEGEPAIETAQGPEDIYRVVVLWGGEPLALGPVRELLRNAKDDAKEAADCLAPVLPAIGSRVLYRGPTVTFSRQGTLATGAIGVVVAHRPAFDANPLGAAVLEFPGGVRRVFRPHMPDIFNIYRVLPPRRRRRVRRR